MSDPAISRVRRILNDPIGARWTDAAIADAVAAARASFDIAVTQMAAATLASSMDLDRAIKHADLARIFLGASFASIEDDGGDSSES